MRTAALTTLATGAGLLLGACSQYLRPGPAAPGRGAPVALPPAPPPDYGSPIVNEQAKAAAEAAIAEAKKNNWRMAVAMVGPEGELIYFEKMDGAQSSSAAAGPGQGAHLGAVPPAQQGLCRPVRGRQCRLHDLSGRGPADRVRRRAPDHLDGKLVGAIGVSGGTAPQDTVVANAGASAVKPSP